MAIQDIISLLGKNVTFFMKAQPSLEVSGIFEGFSVFHDSGIEFYVDSITYALEEVEFSSPVITK